MKKVIYSVLLVFSVAAISQGLHADKGKRAFIKTSPTQSATAGNRGSYNPCSVEGQRIAAGQAGRAQATRIKQYKTQAVLGKNVLLRGRLFLKTANRGLQNQAVKFYINGKSIGTAKTNHIGLARMVYRPPLNLRLQNGYFFLKTEYAGHGKCLKTYSGIGVSARIPTTITLEREPNKPVYYRGKHPILIYLRGKLQSTVDNQGIFGREIQLKINRQLVRRLVSTETGKYSYYYKVPRDLLDRVNVVALFPGDKKYAPTAKRFSFNIKKRQVATKEGYIIFRLPQNYKVKVGQTISLSARVKHKTSVWPKPDVKGVKIGFVLKWGRNDDFSRGLGNAYTDRNGVATKKVTIDKITGHYRIYAYASHPEYKKIKYQKARFELVKSPVYITVKGTKNGKIGDILHLTMTVRRVTDLTPVAKTRVWGFGISEYTRTNNNGQAILKVYLSPTMGLGQKKRLVRSSATNYYLAGERYFKITIYPRND